MKLSYRDRGTLICALHPLAQVALFAAAVIIPLASQSPFSALLAMAVLAALALAAGAFREWFAWWRACAFLFLLALLINPLVSRQGATVLWKGPALPVLGRLEITLEAIVYGLGMGLRISAVMLAFALASLCVDPDRLLGYLSPATSGSALLTAMTLRMVPTVAREAGELVEAQTARGLVRNDGGLLTRWRSRVPLLEKVLRTTLDRAVSVAEAMESRAYGSGRRSRYLKFRFLREDALVCAFALTFCALWIWAVASGWVDFRYYPRVQGRLGAAGAGAMAYALSLSLLFYRWSARWKRSNRSR